MLTSLRIYIKLRLIFESYYASEIDH